MKQISCETIENEVARLCVAANKALPEDIVCAVRAAADNECTEPARSIMCDICENINAAQQLDLAVCQDTGMAVVFLQLGQQVQITGGSLYKAINRGVARGYTQGLLRLSVVDDPLRRKNTGDNTPAIIHTEITDGECLTITVAPKGFGSENMSAVRMLTPAADRECVLQSVVDIVRTAGANPCPPMVIGVGLGGDFEYSAILAKRALCRPIDRKNPDPYYAKLEQDMLNAVNALNIGPQGFSGKTTALSVNIEQFATHIAGLPLAVNIGCHVTRHAQCVL